MKNLLYFAIIVLVIVGCKSCGEQLYGVHEELTPLRVEFDLQIKSIEDFKNFLDTLNSISGSSCLPTSMKTEKNDKIICFPRPNCECYLLSIKSNKIEIPAIFEPTVNSEAWLTKTEQVDDAIINRIIKRFRIDVLAKYYR